MQFSGSWPVDSFLNAQWKYATPEVVDNVGVTLMPAGPQGRYTFLGGSNLAVTSASEQKDLAWEFTRFLSDPERQLHHARSIGSLTARLSSMEQLFDHHPAVKKVFWDSIGHARRLPRLIPLGSVEQIISKMCGHLLSDIRTGKYTARLLEDGIAQANRDVDKVLSLHRYGNVSAGKVAA
jgi:multiple sugar transport system substrate-binding protein